MATLTERLAILVSADVNGAVRGLNKVGTASKKHLGETERRLGLTNAQLSKVGAGFLTFAAGASVGLFKASQATAELSSATGALEAVFGGASAQVKEFAENASELGLSQVAAAQLATKLGGGLKSLGFSAGDAAGEVDKLTERAADMAVGLGSTEQALDAISALLRGERDPIERFGVAIKQVDVNARVAALGLDTSTAAAKKNSEAVAALELLYEQTADRAGLFGSEANKAAREQAQLRAEFQNAAAALGEAVLPVLTSVVSTVGDAVGAFNDLPKPVQSLVSKLALLGTAGAAVVGTAASIASRLDTLGPLFRNAEGGATRFASALGKIGGAIAIGQGLSLLTNQITDLVGLTKDFSNFNRELELLGSIGKEVGAVDLDRIVIAIDEIIDPSGFENVGAGISRGIDTIGQAFTLGALDLRGTAVQYEQELDRIDVALSGLVDAGQAQLAADIFGEISDAVVASGHDAEDATSAFPKYGTAVELMGAKARSADSAIAGLGDTAAGTAGILGSVADTLSAFVNFDPIFSAIDALEDLDQASSGSAAGSKALTSARRDEAEATEEVRVATDALETIRSLSLSTIGDAIAAEGLLADQYGITFDAIEAARSGIRGYIDDQRAAIDPIFNFVNALERQDELLRQGSRARFDAEGNVVGFEEEAGAIELGLAFLDTENAAVQLAAALDDGSVSATKARSIFNQLSKSGIDIPPDTLAELNEIIDEAIARAEAMGGATADLAAQQGLQVEQTSLIEDANDRLATATDRLATAQERVADSAASIAESYNRNSIQAVSAFETAIGRLNDELRDNPDLFNNARTKLAEWVADGKIKASEAEAFIARINELEVAIKVQDIDLGAITGQLPDRLFIPLYLDPTLSEQGREIISLLDTLPEGTETTSDDLLSLLAGEPVTERRHGGPVPGSPGTPVPILAHGGEFVLSADVVDRIRRGQQTLGADTGTGVSAAGSNEFHITVNNPIAQTAEDSVRRELNRSAYLAGVR